MNATSQATHEAHGQNHGNGLLQQAFYRATGARLIPGNRALILRDATENYPAWLGAIAGAKSTIHCESYIIHDDDIGQQFAELLSAKAREGVQVRLIYDWMGALGAASWRFWKPLRRAGVDVRCFNPPRFGSQFGWLSRDHRKMLCVDRQIAFITGLCVGRKWLGDPASGLTPWRDTGVQVEGPAVAEIDRAFADMWAALGLPIREQETSHKVVPNPFPDGAALRIVASSPYTAGLYRFDQVVATLARRSVWLTDAYYFGTIPYIQALGAASRDGVDVRLLVPRSTDIPLLRSFSRAGYAGLLKTGVRIFEWNGSMLHAKTAVIDGRWARVGSTNLNPASWIGNWELDVVVEDERFAHQMEEMYRQDLDNCTELVLTHSQIRARPEPGRAKRKRRARGSSAAAMTGLLKMSRTVHATMASRRVLGYPERTGTMCTALILACLAVAAVVWPRVLSFTISAMSIWAVLLLCVKVLRYKKRNVIPEETAIAPAHAESISGKPANSG